MKALHMRRQRLNPQDYRRLCAEVLTRDDWRCQSCGALQHLEVHHIRFRSGLGGDNRENLITLCTKCHGEVHQKGTMKKLVLGKHSYDDLD
jgi:5-methylcytosine-specific restriction endonuclease McrA